MKTTQWDPKQQYFFCYMLNIEIINYSSVQSLFETLCENVSQTSPPENIHLDEDVFRLRLQKMSLRHLHDVLIKANIFTLVIRLQKTSSRSFQDVLRRIIRL